MFHHMKVQAMRQRFEEKMQALRMTLASNKELWDRLGNAAAGENRIEREFAGTAQQMSLAELRIEELRSQVEANTDHRQKLQGWRKNKARQIMHLEQKLKSHQRFGAINVEGMLQELNEKDQKVKVLREAREREDDIVEEAQDNFELSNLKLKKHLRQKQAAKQAAQAALAKARAESETSILTEEERVELWRGRILETRKRIDNAARENRRLQALVAEKAGEEDDEEESEESDDEW
jgi:hypothetical protein